MRAPPHLTYSTHFKTTQEKTSETAVASTIQSGKNITIDAQKDVAITGAVVHATKDVTVSSSANTFTSAFSTTTTDARAGIGASVGAGTPAFGVTVSASFALQKGEGKVSTPVNTQVSAGETLSVVSGKNTTIQGANLHGSTVDMNVGENLTVASTQERTSSKSTQLSIGGSVTIGYGLMPLVAFPQTRKITQAGALEVEKARQNPNRLNNRRPS
nr:hemagglutinin repeat-containing protein [Halodesulfovibrio spirochaetisodalis]